MTKATAQSISRVLATKFERSKVRKQRITSSMSYGYEVKKDYKGDIVIRCNSGRQFEYMRNKETTTGLIAEFLVSNGYSVEVDANEYYPITVK